MSGAVVGAVLGSCVYVAVGLASPGLRPWRHIASSVLLVVAIAETAKYVPS